MRDAIRTVELSHVNLYILPDDTGDHDCPITEAYGHTDKGEGLEGEGVIFATWQRDSTLSALHHFEAPADAIRFAGRKWQVFPLYYMEHGRCAYSIADFNDRWDSGQAGYILIKKSAYRGAGTRRDVARAWCEQVTTWCNGDYYGYMVTDKNDDCLDSCWGFDDMDYCEEAGLELAKSHNIPIANEEARQAEAARPDMYSDPNRGRVPGKSGTLDR
jgi:hypothetical protein